MRLKNFIFCGLAGGIADFLLGWLLYGIVFRDHFPDEMPNMAFVFLGCMTFGFFASYLFVYLTNLVTFSSGLKAGAVIGLLIGLMSNFFSRAGSAEVDYQNFALDVAIGIIMGAAVGAVVAGVNGALKRP